MNGLKASITSLVALIAVSACSNDWDKQSLGRSFDHDGAAKIKPVNWTAFQKALQPRYAEQAALAEKHHYIDEIPKFTMRAYRASYGSFQLPEELSERDLSKKDAAELGAARKRILAAYEQRGRLLAPTQSAAAQVFFDCWMYKAEDPSQAKGIEQCKTGYQKALTVVEKAIADANRKGPNVKVVLLDGEVTVGKDKLDKECDELTVGSDNGVQSRKKVDGDCPDINKNMKSALSTLPLSPGTFVLYYETDKDIPENASGDKLPEIAKIISENIANREHAEVEINGHADRQASEEYNMGLSQRRAEMIKRLLEENGVKAANWSVNWFGETKNAVETKDGVKERLNRRVEVRIR